MNIAIRVDASRQIGTGHFIRCLTLADALGARGASVRFICRQLPSHFAALLAQSGHQLVRLERKAEEVIPDLPHSHWLGTSQHSDAQESLEALSGHVFDWLIVDHYALDCRWESALRRAATRIIVIDDLADRAHDCDVLLDQNLYAGIDVRYTGKLPTECRTLLGPRYALLRDEFLRVRRHLEPRSGPVKRVLVFFGGADTNNDTDRAIEALVASGHDELQVDVVIGAQHSQRDQIESACARHRFTLHVQTDRMSELMAAADLAIGAGGSATWERCCLGLPTFAISTATNQSRQVADAASDGLLYAPQLGGDPTDAMRLHLSALRVNDALRHFMSRRGMQAVDGRGVSRVIGHLDVEDIIVRPAEEDDSAKLFEWRNHPTIRVMSLNSAPIEWAHHQEWFAAVRGDPNRLLLIGERDGVAAGVVRFDIQGSAAEVSIYLVPGAEGAGVGRDLLRTAERRLVRTWPAIAAIRARVLGSNERSEALFVGAGYRVDETAYSKRLH